MLELRRGDGYAFQMPMSGERSFTVARAAAWVPSICPSLVFATALSCTACGSGCVPWAETNPGSTNSEALVYQNESGEIVVTSAFTTSDETSWMSVRFYDQFGGRPQERPLPSLLEQIAGKAIDPQNSSYVASVTEVGFDGPMDWIRGVPRDEFRIGIVVRRGRSVVGATRSLFRSIPRTRSSRQYMLCKRQVRRMSLLFPTTRSTH